MLPIWDQQFVRRSPASPDTHSFSDDEHPLPHSSIQFPPNLQRRIISYNGNVVLLRASFQRRLSSFQYDVMRFPLGSNFSQVNEISSRVFIRKVLATLALSMGTLSSGLAKGYTSPALDSILDNQPPHLYQSSNNDTW